MSEIKDKIKEIIWAEYCSVYDCDVTLEEMQIVAKEMIGSEAYKRMPLLNTYADKIVESLTPSDLAALAEPMGLALVTVEPTREMKHVVIADWGRRTWRQFKDVIEAGRIKPKQAEKGKYDE